MITCVDQVPRAVASRWLDEHALWLGRRPPAPRVELEREPIAKPHQSGLVKRLLRALSGRPARPQRAFRIGLALARAGVRAARPLALIEERRGGLVRRSCLLVEAIEAVNLRDFILSRLRQAARQDAEVLKRRLWIAVARETARLHAARVRQRDLKAPNVLVAEGAGGRVEATLIDLEGMAFLSAPPSPAVRARDLARLAASLREAAVRAAGVTEDDWRFLVERYLEQIRGSPPSPEETDRFMARTLEWAARKEARNRRRGRVTH